MLIAEEQRVYIWQESEHVVVMYFDDKVGRFGIFDMRVASMRVAREEFSLFVSVTS